MKKHRQGRETRKSFRIPELLMAFLIIAALVVPMGVKASETADGSASGASQAVEEEVPAKEEVKDTSSSDEDKEIDSPASEEKETIASDEKEEKETTASKEKEEKEAADSKEKTEQPAASESTSSTTISSDEKEKEGDQSISDQQDDDNSSEGLSDHAVQPGGEEDDVTEAESDGNKKGSMDAEKTDSEKDTAAETDTGTEGIEENDSSKTAEEASLEPEKEYTAGVLTYKGSDYKVTVNYDQEACIPAGASLYVKEITEKQNDYQHYFDRAEKAVTEKSSENNEKVTMARFFDITIMVDGKEIQPEKPIEVKIELSEKLTEDVKTVHFGEEVEVLDTALEDGSTKDDTVSFESGSFSVYGVLKTEVITGEYLSAKRETYHIEVTLDERDTAPENAHLSVTEIEKGTDSFNKYLDDAVESIGEEGFEVSYARFFNISILDGDEKEYEPEYPAQVVIIHDEAIELGEDEQLNIVHFGEKETEVIENVPINSDGKEVSYTQNGFSVTGEIAGSIIGRRCLCFFMKYLFFFCKYKKGYAFF